MRYSCIVTERELVDLMATSGRKVSLTNLAGWRKQGLLPPLASHGLGTGKGKSYCWHEANILAHASAVHDLLQSYGRPETVLWMLWLAGFSVPLRQFRRVWALRSRPRALWFAKPREKYTPGKGGTCRLRLPALEGCSGTAHVLFDTALTFAGTLVPDDGDGAAIVRVIEKALAWVAKTEDIPRLKDQRVAENLWLMVRIMAAALETSDLVSLTKDAELREAQRYLRLAGKLLQKCDDRAPGRPQILWPAWLAERLAGPVFLAILVLLRSERKALLDKIAETLEKPSRRAIHAPVRAVYSTL